MTASLGPGFYWQHSGFHMAGSGFRAREYTPTKISTQATKPRCMRILDAIQPDITDRP